MFGDCLLVDIEWRVAVRGNGFRGMQGTEMHICRSVFRECLN